MPNDEQRDMSDAQDDSDKGHTHQDLNVFQLATVEGRCGPNIYGALPSEDSPLRPLAEARGFAKGCIECLDQFNLTLATIDSREVCSDDRWWVQFELVAAHNTASAALTRLASGVREVLTLTYSENRPITTAGFTRSNAHDVVAAIVLDVVRRAWGVIYDREEYGKGVLHPVKQGSKGLTFPVLLTFRSPRVSMLEGHDRELPLFREEYLPAVLDTIRTRPAFDRDELRARLEWEYVHAAQLVSRGVSPYTEVEAPIASTIRMSTGSRCTLFTKRFAVALSFPGEHRLFVESVADAIAQELTRERVLYDNYYEHEFARPDLDTYLQGLYHSESELLVVFLCAEYQNKRWCKLEWRAIRDLITRKDASRVMLVRLDDSEVQGIYPGDGYVDARSRSPKEIADVVLKRLDLVCRSVDV